jgi:hypothetical protein
VIDHLVHHDKVINLKGDSYPSRTATWTASPPKQPKTNKPEEGFRKSSRQALLSSLCRRQDGDLS